MFLAHSCHSHIVCIRVSYKSAVGLTKKAEPPPTRDVNRDSGTDRANGGWLRRLVRQHGHNSNLRPNKMQRQTAAPRKYRAQRAGLHSSQESPALRLHLGNLGINLSLLTASKRRMQLQIN